MRPQTASSESIEPSEVADRTHARRPIPAATPATTTASMTLTERWLRFHTLREAALRQVPFTVDPCPTPCGPGIVSRRVRLCRDVRVWVSTFVGIGLREQLRGRVHFV